MKILLATDGSEYSETAAKFLTLFNFSPEDIVTLFHVISEIIGRGSDKPCKLPTLGVNAQSLRFLDFLAQDTL